MLPKAKRSRRGKAGGGGGYSYTGGERGAERVVIPSNGFVIPNHALKGPNAPPLGAEPSIRIGGAVVNVTRHRSAGRPPVTACDNLFIRTQLWVSSTSRAAPSRLR